MIDPVDELSRRARLVKKRIANGDAQTLARLPVGEEDVRHKHCLALVARELGFVSHAHAARVLRGDPGEPDFGTLLHTYGGFLNAWFATYEEARASRAVSGGYLIGYKRQFIVVERGYIEALGLDPDDADWEAIGFDMVAPRDTEARQRLYAKRLRALPDVAPG